jgi:uncharacterized protein YjbI with pentapeptide repeats
MMRDRLSSDDPQHRMLDLRGVVVNEDLAKLVTAELKRAKQIGRIDLSGAVIKARLEVTCEGIGSLTGSGSHFEDVLTISCRKAGTVFFMDAQFDDLVRLGPLQVEEIFSFRQATFNNALYVGAMQGQEVVFDQELDLQSATFSDGVLLGAIRGKGHLNLNATTLAGRVQARGLSLMGDLGMHSATIDGDLDLSGARVSGYVGLVDAAVNGQCFWDDAIFGSLSMRRAVVSDARELGRLTIREWLVLDEAAFERSVRIQASAETIHVHRAVFREGASLQLRGDLVCDGSSFGGASDITRLGSGIVPAGDSEEDAPICRIDIPQRQELRVLSLRTTDLEHMTISDANLSLCLMSGAHRLERLRLGSGVRFADRHKRWSSTRELLFDELRWARRVSNPESDKCAPGADVSLPRWMFTRKSPKATPTLTIPIPVGPSPDAVADEYRALRKSREDAADYPGSADFYYGEMEMRRGALAGFWRAGTGLNLRDKADGLLLSAYWLVSGYGLRALRSLTTLALLLMVAIVMLHLVGYQPRQSYLKATEFAITSATSLIRPVKEEHLTFAGVMIEMVLRIAGPVLVALAVLALRARVRR